MLNNILIVVPYVGELNDYQLYALKQLSETENIDLAFITDRGSIKQDSKNFSYSTYDIDSVFKHDNRYGIKLSDIKCHPYKLCDFKIIIGELFDIFDEDKHDFLGFADLDCIFNVAVLSNKTKNINDIDSVYGDRGHLTIMGKNTLRKTRNKLSKTLKYYMSRGVDLFEPSKGYAIDEFFFFHPILVELEKEGGLKWRQDYFKPLLDVDYKHLYPRNLVKNNFLFSIHEILEDDMVSKLSYIHLQKRRIIGNLYSSNPKKYNSFSVNEIGVIEINASDKKIIHYRKIEKFMFFLNVFCKRLRYRIDNFGIMPRPRYKVKK